MRVITSWIFMIVALAILTSCASSPKAKQDVNAVPETANAIEKKVVAPPVQWTEVKEIVREPPPKATVVKRKEAIVPLPEVVRARESEGGKRKTKDVKTVIDQSNADAREQPDSDYFQNANMVFNFEKGRLYQVYTAVLHTTDITLQPGEVLTSKPSLGGSSQWKLATAVSGAGPHQRIHILIKPTRPGLKTNFSLYTNKRSYYMEVYSFRETYMSQVSWDYPGEIQDLRYDQALNDYQTVVQDNIDPTSLNHNYEIEAIGERPPWFPIGVFDDGRKVYIQFPEVLSRFEAPALFILKKSGKIQVVNFRKKGLYYEVDRLFERADLRVGSGSDIEVVRITFAPAKEKYELYW